MASSGACFASFVLAGPHQSWLCPLEWRSLAPVVKRGWKVCACRRRQNKRRGRFMVARTAVAASAEPTSKSLPGISRFHQVCDCLEIAPTPTHRVWKPAAWPEGLFEEELADKLAIMRLPSGGAVSADEGHRVPDFWMAPRRCSLMQDLYARLIRRPSKKLDAVARKIIAALGQSRNGEDLSNPAVPTILLKLQLLGHLEEFDM
ncbi:hypothetical protein CONLIGDRAFT_638719 [Coniochaeta ligniaria NRRL 30616]|uniref:Uncharacterized protein n=1 Tax=Coniochaeta ligniaria NRRL 30616 TaxID=1408157 RepID=A0A1J7JWB3_9PEZI|nr:hypothetical protein CONLIGDRAFT_638719 [Coniochaeta ligniaria NRRL 30616]